MAEMINDSPYTFPGVSDGGAHTKFFTGGAFTTDFLRWLVRDEQKITLEEAHYRLSALPAHAAGFRDRGVLREGAAADVVVYDLDGARHRAGLGRRDRARLAGRRMAPGAARERLPRDHRQRRETFADGDAPARRRGGCCVAAAADLGVPEIQAPASVRPLCHAAGPRAQPPSRTRRARLANHSPSACRARTQQMCQSNVLSLSAVSP